MASKAPRRTAERILETALDLFNRFGEPNVSATAVAAQMGISAGNLCYHYPTKNDLVDALFDRHASTLAPLLQAARDVGDVESAWFFLHALFEQLWHDRFLYRDINDLLSRNRHLEIQFQQVLQNMTQAIRELLAGMKRTGAMTIETREIEPTATSMVVVLTYWLSFEYARDPRHAQDHAAAQHALLRGAYHVLHLLAPYLESGQRRHLLELAGAYCEPGR